MAEVSKIEQELLDATAFKSKKNEETQAYLVRLMRAVAKLKDPDWEALSTDAQNWNNDAAQAFQEGKPIVNFSDIEEEAEESEEDEAVEDSKVDEEESEEDEEESAPVAAKANGQKDKPKSKPAPVQTGRKISACHIIKKMVVKKPQITVTELSEKLKADGLKVSDVTIATLRSDLRDTLRVLNELGAGNFKL